MLRFCQDNILSCWNKFNNLLFAWSGFSWGLWSCSTELWCPHDLGWCSCVLSGYVFLPWPLLTWETFSFPQLKFLHLSRQPCCSESWATFSSDVNHLYSINNTFFFLDKPTVCTAISSLCTLQVEGHYIPWNNIGQMWHSLASLETVSQDLESGVGSNIQLSS